MHYAISMKVLGQTHMWYVLKTYTNKLFEFFTFYVILDFYTHQNKAVKVRSNAKTMQIKKCKMHKCMIKKHLMHEGSYKDRKN